MIPGEYDLELYRGDYHSLQFVLWQDEAKTLALDVSNTEVRCQIRDKPKPVGITMATLDTEIIEPNTIFVRITADMWDDPINSWPVKKGFWDLEVDFGNDDIRTFVAGKVKIRPDVTDVDIP